MHIRPYAVGDEAALFDAASSSWRELQPWMPWCHENYALADATAWVTRQVAMFEAKSEFDFVFLEDGVMVGASGLNQLDAANRRANLGYWMRTSATRRGIATAAVKKVFEWAFENTELERLEIVVAVGNIASLRVAQKAGAQVEGTLRNRILLHGVFHDAVMHSICRGDS